MIDHLEHVDEPALGVLPDGRVLLVSRNQPVQDLEDSPVIFSDDGGRTRGDPVYPGVGMAAPHVVIAFFPQIVNRIPRAGRWSELLREFVGFIILAIIMALLGTQTSDSFLSWLMMYIVVLATCLWMWGRWITFATPPGRKWAIRLAAIAIAVAAGWWMLKPAAPPLIKMRDFDATAIKDARADGKVVLVKFTAGWCTKCWILERTIYSDPDVAAGLKTRGIVTVKGDVTKNEYPASRMLYDELRQSGPPVTAIFAPGDAPPILLHGDFDKADLFDALDKAMKTGSP